MRMTAASAAVPFLRVVFTLPNRIPATDYCDTPTGREFKELNIKKCFSFAKFVMGGARVYCYDLNL
jgi:hypothetical protein